MIGPDDDAGDPAAHAAPSPPLAPPPDLRLRASPPPVMRISRKALAVAGVVAGAGIGGALIFALQPSHPKAAPELMKTEGRPASESLTSAPKDYSQVPKLGPPLPGDLGRPILSAQQRGVDVAAPPIGAGGPAPAPHATAAQAARERSAQERDAARTSRLFFGGGTAAPGLAIPMAVNADAAMANGNRAAPADAGPPAPGGEDGKRTFLRAGDDRPTLASGRLTPPVSPFVVQAGSIIPAALITGIRSDLPGQITALVTQNVYDSLTGRTLLIPQGSRLVGEYDSQVSGGQNRVLLAWDRLILPDGRSVTLDRQPGADAAGFAGLQDRVDYHWGRLAKAALLSTLLGMGAELASDREDNLARAIRDGTQDTVNQTGQQLVRREISVPPTLTVRPGYPLRVIVTRDLILQPEIRR